MDYPDSHQESLGPFASGSRWEKRVSGDKGCPLGTCKRWKTEEASSRETSLSFLVQDDKGVCFCFEQRSGERGKLRVNLLFIIKNLILEVEVKKAQ